MLKYFDWNIFLKNICRQFSFSIFFAFLLTQILSQKMVKICEKIFFILTNFTCVSNYDLTFFPPQFRGGKANVRHPSKGRGRHFWPAEPLQRGPHPLHHRFGRNSLHRHKMELPTLGKGIGDGVRGIYHQFASRC